MTTCKLCLQAVTQGVPVPGRQQASGIVHEECVAAMALKAAQDPQKEGLLRCPSSLHQGLRRRG